MSAPQPPFHPYPRESAGVRAISFAARFGWMMIPIISLGFLGWVPAVHVARQRRTQSAWWWMGSLIAASVTLLVLLSVVPDQAKNDPGAYVGAFALANIITAAVYAWKHCGPLPPLPNRHPGPHPQYDTAWNQTAYVPAPQYATPPMAQAGPQYPAPYATQYNTPPAAPMQPVTSTGLMPAGPGPMPDLMPAGPGPMPDPMAAEVQADLRELRDLLGGEGPR